MLLAECGRLVRSFTLLKCFGDGAAAAAPTREALLLRALLPLLQSRIRAQRRLASVVVLGGRPAALCTNVDATGRDRAHSRHG